MGWSKGQKVAMTRFSWKKQTLVRKMIAGFAAMAFFTFTAMALSFIGLYSMHKTAKDIARHDLVLIKAADKLRDILQDQDAVAAKYAILKKSEYINQFRRYEAEFLGLLEIVRPDMPAPEASFIISRYSDYRYQAGR